jgi:hypothetical protein
MQRAGGLPDPTGVGVTAPQVQFGGQLGPRHQPPAGKPALSGRRTSAPEADPRVALCVARSDGDWRECGVPPRRAKVKQHRLGAWRRCVAKQQRTCRQGHRARRPRSRSGAGCTQGPVCCALAKERAADLRPPSERRFRPACDALDVTRKTGRPKPVALLARHPDATYPPSPRCRLTDVACVDGGSLPLPKRGAEEGEGRPVLLLKRQPAEDYVM